MIRKFYICLLLLFSSNLFALTVGTYNAPPFSMHEDGEDIGLATEALRTLLQKSDIAQYNIINYPLARGLAEFHAGRIDIYYPFVQDTADKSDKYVLIGPISTYKVALFVRKDYPHEVSIPAMTKLVVGAERGSIGDLLLQKHDMHIEQATQAVSCLRMVLADRISACAIGTLPGMYAAAINNLSGDLRYVETGSFADMYVALGASVPPELVTKIQNAYASLKDEDYFAQQQHEYEKKFAVFIKSMS